MKNLLAYLVLVNIIYSCNHDDKLPLKITLSQKEVNDMCCVKDSSYKQGDVRRYGIYPNRPFSDIQWSKVAELADKGMPLTFNKGMYHGNIILKGVDSISIHFNDVIIAGGLQIIGKEEKVSNHIILTGKLTVLDKVFIKQSHTIQFERLNISTDTLHNIHNKQNRGLSIYAGSQNIYIDSLKISDTGGNDDVFYTHSAAAMQVHGYNNNPKKINIKYLKIKNAARSALYLTGNNHNIKKIEIDNFGFGSNANMFGLEDAKPEAQKMFSGAWFNKCNDCTIDTLILKAKPNNKMYSANFGLGVYSKPCIINNIMRNSYAKEMPIKDDVLTNVLVKRILEDD